MNRTPLIIVLSLLAATAALLRAAPALASEDAAGAFQRDVAAMTQSASRLVGSSGYDAAGKYIEEQVRALPGVELRVQSFPVMVPVTQSATLDAGAGRIERIYPFWPAHVRVCSTPAEGLSGRLVYAGECRLDQLRPASLRGQIAVVEASAGQRWVQAVNMGARALLILGQAQTGWPQLRSQDLRIPINIPRFYVPPGPLAEDLRASRIDHAVLRARVTWETRTARNIFALVRAAHPPSSADPAALMFSVRYDASSLVPDLAPGASQAVQAAAGLKLLRDVAAHPWRRPVVFFFSGADSIQFLGTRHMFMALADPPALWRQQITALDAEAQAAGRDLARARAALEAPAGLRVTADRELIARAVQIIETDQSLAQDELFRLRSAPADQSTQSQRARIARLEADEVSRSELKSAFERDPALLRSASMSAAARQVLQRVVARLGGDATGDGLARQLAARRALLEQRIALYGWLAGATGRPADPDPSRNDERSIDLLVGLDFSDRGSACGPMFFGNFQRTSGMAQIQEYRDWFTTLQRDCDRGKPQAQWWNGLKNILSLDPLHQRRLPPTYLAGPLPIPSELAQAWGVPGLSMITLDDLRLHRDTPNDTLDRLDLAAIVPQVRAVETLFAHASADADFRGPDQLRRMTAAITGQVVSLAPGMPVPDLPRAGFLASYFYVANKATRIPQLGALPWTLGIRRDEVRACDAEGRYRFEGLPKLRADRLEGIEKQQADLQLIDVQVYRIDPDSGAIVATSDLGKAGGDLRTVVDIRQPIIPLRSLVFHCQEFALTRLYDPRYLQALREVLPLDAVRGAEPQRFNLLLADEMLAGFVEPGTRLDLLIRYGQVGNRIALLNMPPPNAPAPNVPASRDRREMTKDPKARGYTPAQLNSLGPLALTAARDFWRLDEGRLRDYRAAGVSSSLVDDLHAAARRQIDAADAAVRADDGPGLARAATGAWASEARVYEAAQSMARDVIRAAVLLLILCVPFAFCMERLLIASTNIYRQIAGACAIFAVMALALWSFHPAFKISTSPLIVILAFAIILMSCIVIAVVYGKFNTELARLRSGGSAGAGGIGIAAAGAGGGGGAGVAGGAGGVFMSAAMLGLANMRRRKFRTFLTSITIVLITFAVLSFTSTTQYIGTRTWPTGIASAFPGLELRQRGFRPMPPAAADQLRAALSDPAMKLPHAPTVVEQWWAVSTIEPNEQYDLVAPPRAGPARVVSLPAILGLSPGAAQLSNIAQVIGPAKFARLEAGQRPIIYLSRATARQLGVNEGAAVRLGGIDLTVAGVFDGARYDREVKTLAGQPLAPLKYTAGQLDAGGRRLDDTTAESLDVAGSSEASTSYEFLSADEFAIVPAPICRLLYKSTLRSLALRLDNQQQVQAASGDLARRFALAMFAGYDDGVRMVAAGSLSSVRGAAGVAVPLIVAALIIFNTMLGSIAERRREIHVYTSLGLAPLHVGALFVAEALVYGLIGTVFGYVIGQGAATLLQHLGWLGGATLNFSGTSAIATMGLVLLIVLLSSLVPARLASKIAAPSIDRTWKVPEPVGDSIRAELPFTINQRFAEGALAYLVEFFEAHREGAIGNFAAGPVSVLGGDVGTWGEGDGGGRQGDGETGRQGDKETRGQGDKETRGQGDEETGRHGEMEAGGEGDQETTIALSPCPPVALSPRRPLGAGLTTDVWLNPFDLGVRQRLTLRIHPGRFPDVFEVDVILKRLRGDDRNWRRMNRPFLTELRRQFLQWRSLSAARMAYYIDRSRSLFANDSVKSQ